MPEPCSDSLPPPELEELQELRAKDKRNFSIDLDKRVIGIIATIFTVCSGYGGWQLVTKAQLDERTAEIKAEARDERDELKQDVQKNTAAIVVVSATVKQVQEVQHLDVAHREARRVVEDAIKCRRNDNGCQDRRDRELERIRQLNMRRLQAKRPRPPCANLACN